MKRSTVHVVEDEYGVVSIFEDGTLRMFMSRQNYDDLRRSLDLPPYEPGPVVSGGGILYGIPRRETP